MIKNIKIESLIFLKSLGIAPEPLLIIEKLPNQSDFFKKLKKYGFQEKQKISVRFSAPEIMEMPRTFVFDNFKEIYNFVKKYLPQKSAAIIHPFIEALYVGTVLFCRNEIIINLIKSAIWEPEITKNCDIFLIKNKKIKIYQYLKERITYKIQGKKLVKQKIKPLNKKEIEKLLSIFRKENFIFNQLNKFKNTILEFIIDWQGNFYGLEMEHSVKEIKSFNFKEDNFLKIKRYRDIEKWDKKQNLLLTLDIFRRDKDKFLNLIEKIKPYKKEVFIEYGLLSHPAILLREKGLKTKNYIKNYKVLVY